jgi:PAS domain S-box-containing protein
MNGMTIIRDMMKQGQTEEPVKEIESYFRAITEHSSDIIIIVDAQGTITYTSPSIERFVGYRPDELIGTSGFDMILPDDNPRASEDFIRALLTKEVVIPNSFRIRHKDGTERIFEGVGKNLLDNPIVAGFVMNVRDITDRRRAEEDLLAVNRRLHDIIDFLPDATFAIDKERKVVAWNRAIEEMTGVAASDMLGRGDYEYSLPFYGERRPILIDLIFEKVADDLAAKYSAIERRRNFIFAETCIPSLRGKEVHLWGKASALLDVGGNLIGAIESIRDVTDRKVVEEALRQSEVKYRAIFENATEGIFQIAKDGSFISVNKAFARIFGYATPEELIFHVRQVKHEMYAHQEDRERIRSLLGETGQVRGVECEFIDKHGRKIWVAINAHNVSDASGRFLHYEGTVVDISDRKLMEQKLLDTKDKLAEAQRIGRIGSWEYDLSTGAMWYSDELCHIGGCDPQQGPFDLETTLQRVHREDREVVAKALEAAVGEMKPYDLSHRIVCPDGSERIIHSRGKVFCDSVGRPVRIAGITQDITKEKILERQVMHQEKLASLGMLVSGIAHEINNPNNFITFNIPILRDYVRELMRIADAYADAHPDYELFGMTYREFREDIFNLLDNIEHGTGRIDGTVRKLQEFSRKKNGEERRLASIEEVVSQAVAICRSQIGRMVKDFEVETAPELPAMLTDADALEQILVNILINAGQAADKEESRIALRLVSRASWENRIIIEIEDNGAGMDQATKNSIFDPFFTTKPRGKGTGLGLYIARNLIQSLGGSIEVESEPGRGSLFRISLPELNIHG